MTPRLPSFVILTGRRELTVELDHAQWIDPDRALGLLWTMLGPTLSRFQNEQISSRTVDVFRHAVQGKLQDLVHKGVIWESWGAFGIGSDVTVRIRPRQRGAA